jgi:hypothetical protein
MRIRTATYILLAVIISILVVLGSRLLRTPETCSETALDAVLAGGRLVLPDQCVILAHSTKIITGNVVIQAQANFTVIGTHYEAAAHRVFEVRDGATLSLENIIVTEGQVINNSDRLVIGGAGILNYGTLELLNSHIEHNRTRRGIGAGIYNGETGIVQIENTEIALNSSLGAPGAGIVNLGQMTLTNSTVHHNLASEVENDEMAGFAAGIWNQGTMTVHSTNIHDNTASRDVGVLNMGHLTMTHSHITHNIATLPNLCSGGGAGVINTENATAIIYSSTISHNRASKYGGGIVNWSEMTVRSSSIIHNDACSTVGGIMNIRTGDLTIENSIIAENTAGRYQPGRWGLANLATTDGVTPTFVGQNNYWGSADGPSGEGPGSGDGIYGAEPTSYTPWLVQPPDWARNKISGRYSLYPARA